MNSQKVADSNKLAWQIVIIMGLVSLFGDMVYEGGRSVHGAYLGVLGANMALVGIIAGAAEFLGYAVRLLAGLWSDKTRAYWVFAFAGYGALASVPLMALTGIWEAAALLIVAERLGKALRSPAKDTILSLAAKRVGAGKAFGIQEAMDQIGAFLGPLIFAVLFFAKGPEAIGAEDYRTGYAWLWIPFAAVMILVAIASMRLPKPEILAEGVNHEPRHSNPRKILYLYILFTFFATMGLANYALFAFHFVKAEVVPGTFVPVFYAVAMAVDAGAALLLGKWYDRYGLRVLLVIPPLTILSAALGFASWWPAALGGVIVWGIVMGAHETIMRAAIADLTPLKKRGTAYGLFHTAYGLSVGASSVAMGFLYEAHAPDYPWSIALVTIASQIAAIAVWVAVRRESKKTVPADTAV